MEHREVWWDGFNQIVSKRLVIQGRLTVQCHNFDVQ
jgi:hypothetical protein